MKEYFERLKGILSNIIFKFFSCYKIYMLVFFVVFLIGFITGIMTSASYASSIDCEHLINSYLYNFLIRESTMFGLFLTLAIYLCIVFVLMITLSKNMFLIVIDSILLFLMAYIYGFDLCIIIVTLGVAGVFFGILIWGLLGVLLFFILISLLSLICSKVREEKRSCSSNEKSYYVKAYIVFLIISLFVLFLMCILFSIIHIFVIVE